jgi:hypothetical protein
MTPTIVLVDSAGKVLDSWRGALQPDAEREVFAALGLPYTPPAGSTFAAANVKKTAHNFRRAERGVVDPPAVTTPERSSTFCRGVRRE